MVDIENDKWINIEMGYSVTAEAIINAKRLLRDYAEELGDWIVETDKKGYVSESGNRLYSLCIKPKGGKISPEELRIIRDKLMRFAYSILRNVIYAKGDWTDEEVVGKLRTTIDVINEKKDVAILIGEIISIKAPLPLFIKLEKEDYNLTEASFGISFKWWKKQVEEELASSKFWLGRNKKIKPKYEEALDFINGALKMK